MQKLTDITEWHTVLYNMKTRLKRAIHLLLVQNKLTLFYKYKNKENKLARDS